MKTNVNYRLDPISQQPPRIAGSDEAQRIARIVMSWASLNPKASALLTLSNGSLSVQENGVQIKNVLNASQWNVSDLVQPGFELAMNVSQIGLQLFCPRLMFITHAISHGYKIIILTKDGIIHLKDQEWKKALFCGGQILSSSIYIASSFHGSHLLRALSLSMQGATELGTAFCFLSQENISNLDYLEALSNAVLGCLRLYQAKDQASTFYRNQFGHQLTQKEVKALFSTLPASLQEAQQDDLDCLKYTFLNQEKFDFEGYLKEHNISSQLKGLDFGQLYSVEKIAFNNLEFVRCSFDATCLEDCSFDNARFSQTTFLDAWVSDSSFTNSLFSNCYFNRSRMLNLIWDNVAFNACSIHSSAFVNSSFSNVQFTHSEINQSYLNSSTFINTTFDQCYLNEAVFLGADAKNSQFIDSELTDNLLCDTADQFHFDDKTVVHIPTKPVIAYSSDPYEMLEWGDINDPLADALRDAGALVLMFNYSPPEVDAYKLKEEIHLMRPQLVPHKLRSVPIQLFEKAKTGSEIAKIQKITQKVMHMCDGVCIPGGMDVNPVLYGKKIDEYDYWWYDDCQDMMEAGAIYSAMQDQKPVIGICRGAQLGAVVNGGTLKDVPFEGGFDDYVTRPWPGTKEHQLFQSIYGTDHVGGLSCHSQAIKDVPEGFSIFGRES